jgi:hypothetical protein
LRKRSALATNHWIGGVTLAHYAVDLEEASDGGERRRRLL